MGASFEPKEITEHQSSTENQRISIDCNPHDYYLYLNREYNPTLQSQKLGIEYSANNKAFSASITKVGSAAPIMQAYKNCQSDEAAQKESWVWDAWQNLDKYLKEHGHNFRNGKLVEYAKEVLAVVLTQKPADIIAAPLESVS